MNVRLEGPLDRERLEVLAGAIHAVMLAAYAVEAEWLGVRDFVPLRRTVDSLLSAPTRFHVAWLGDRLAGAAEVDASTEDVPNLDALVVAPEHFRRGVGRALVGHVLREHGAGPLTVSTGERNAAAIALYESCGFAIVRRWRTDDGIPMVTLRREPPDVRG